jgi:hypothetical protein
MSDPHPETGTGLAETPATTKGGSVAGKAPGVEGRASRKRLNSSPDPDDHALVAARMQEELIRAMTPGRRLEVARELYETAWQLKAAGLRREHPDWSDREVLAKLRRVFLTGYAGA